MQIDQNKASSQKAELGFNTAKTKHASGEKSYFQEELKKQIASDSEANQKLDAQSKQPQANAPAAKNHSEVKNAHAEKKPKHGPQTRENTRNFSDEDPHHEVDDHSDFDEEVQAFNALVQSHAEGNVTQAFPRESFTTQANNPSRQVYAEVAHENGSNLIPLSDYAATPIHRNINSSVSGSHPNNVNFDQKDPDYGAYFDFDQQTQNYNSLVQNHAQGNVTQVFPRENFAAQTQSSSQHIYAEVAHQNGSNVIPLSDYAAAPMGKSLSSSAQANNSIFVSVPHSQGVTELPMSDYAFFGVANKQQANVNAENLVPQNDNYAEGEYAEDNPQINENGVKIIPAHNYVYSSAAQTSQANLANENLQNSEAFHYAQSDINPQNNVNSDVGAQKAEGYGLFNRLFASNDSSAVSGKFQPQQQTGGAPFNQSAVETSAHNTQQAFVDNNLNSGVRPQDTEGHGLLNKLFASNGTDSAAAKTQLQQQAGAQLNQAASANSAQNFQQAAYSAQSANVVQDQYHAAVKSDVKAKKSFGENSFFNVKGGAHGNPHIASANNAQTYGANQGATLQSQSFAANSNLSSFDEQNYFVNSQASNKGSEAMKTSANQVFTAPTAQIQNDAGFSKINIPQFAAQIKANYDKNQEVFTVRLNPAGLGEVKIILSKGMNKISAKIITENEETRKKLESQIGELKKSLDDKNLPIVSFDISSFNEDKGGTNFAFNKQHKNPDQKSDVQIEKFDLADFSESN